jgi:hypothetical protein
VHFAGITSAPSHTSEEKLNGWTSFNCEIYALWNMSPAGLREFADFCKFFLLALAMCTNHTNDQKKLPGFEDTL